MFSSISIHINVKKILFVVMLLCFLGNNTISIAEKNHTTTSNQKQQSVNKTGNKTSTNKNTNSGVANQSAKKSANTANKTQKVSNVNNANNKTKNNISVANSKFSSDKQISILIDETEKKQGNSATQKANANSAKNEAKGDFYAGMVGDKRSGKGLNLALTMEEREQSGNWLLIIDGNGVEKNSLLQTSIQQNPTRFVIDVKTNLMREKIVNFTYQMPKDLRLRYGNQPNGYRIVIDLPANTRIATKSVVANQIAVKLINAEMIAEYEKNKLNSSGTNAKRAVYPQTGENFKDFGGLKTLSNGATFRKIMIEHGKPYVIAIDAGHGGIDCGAKGKNINEKTITLKYAKSLAKALKRRGFQVVMTREDDRTIPLLNRVKTAQQKNADVFISLHADAHNDKKVSGTSVYRLSHLEQQHPDWEKFYRSGVLPEKYEKYKQDKSVLDILVGLTHQSLSEKSSILVDNVLLSFKKNGVCKNCRHGQRSLAVLRGLKMVSILIEIGYITNPEEEKKMLLESNIEKFANNLANTIFDTFN